MSRKRVLELALALIALAIFSCVRLYALDQVGEYYASPEGTGEACTKAAPCNLPVALSRDRSPLRSGDTLWLFGGTYHGSFKSYLQGKPDAPIIVRQFPGERAILDGGNSRGNPVLTIAGSYTWFWGFEIMSSSRVRVSAQTGSQPTDIPAGEGVMFDQVSGHGVGIKLINLVIHDTRQGVSFWKEAEDSEISGCIIFNNGWDGPEGDRGHGHGIYVQNQVGTKRIVDNVIFNQFSHGIHAYGSQSAHLDNLYVEGNVLFHNGAPSNFGLERNVLIGGESVAHNIRFVQNYAFEGKTQFGFTAPAERLAIIGNYLPDLVAIKGKDVSMSENTYLADRIEGFAVDEFPDNTYLSGRPKDLRVFVTKNTYEPDRAILVIYNWTERNTIEVDLSPVLKAGDSFQIFDVQDYPKAPISAGLYSGRPVSIDVGSLRDAAPPIGGSDKALHTPKTFEVLLITSEPGSSSILSRNATGH